MSIASSCFFSDGFPYASFDASLQVQFKGCSKNGKRPVGSSWTGHTKGYTCFLSELRTVTDMTDISV